MTKVAKGWTRPNKFFTMAIHSQDPENFQHIHTPQKAKMTGWKITKFLTGDTSTQMVGIF